MLPLLLPLPLTDVGVEGDVESDVPVVVVVVDEEDESLEGSCGRASRWSLTERTSSSSELRLGGFFRVRIQFFVSPAKRPPVLSLFLLEEVGNINAGDVGRFWGAK